ncbi:hypothetical protein [Agrobacterium radiobacter]|uniref:hypothetical protein n=1 Tax=Agrobacterium radiobacter TaxID=362 RepID=UPI003CE745D0
MTALEEIKRALEEVTPERVERLWWFLHILAKSTGTTNAEDDKWNWINAFCTDYEDDTFNLAAKLGFITVRHDSFMETSTARITKAGMALVAHFDKAPSAALTSTLESLQRENEELRKDKDHIAAEKTGIAKNSHNNVDYWKSQAEAAEAEVKRLETELALSKPLYSRRQIEARVKALEAALKPFAEYMGDHFDKDNHGNPLPDDLGVGWIYLTHADFRRARTALASTGGEHHGN